MSELGVLIGAGSAIFSTIALLESKRARKETEDLTLHVSSLQKQLTKFQVDRLQSGQTKQETARNEQEAIGPQPPTPSRPVAQYEPVTTAEDKDESPVIDLADVVTDKKDASVEPTAKTDQHTIDDATAQTQRDRLQALRDRVNAADTEQKAAPTAPVQSPVPMYSPKEDEISLEEKLGTRMAVWIGSIAIALAGIFLVRYMAQQGLLNATTRVILAAISGVALLGVGEFFRKTQERIGQGLTAAGVAILYGTIVSATSVHEMIQPMSGFIFAIGVTVAAILLSLRHGPFVALLGLLGGFLTPALLDVNDVSVLQLFGYLFLLQTAILILGRAREWAWLVTLATAGGLFWSAIWMLTMFDSGQANGLGIFLLASVMTYVVVGPEDEKVLPIGKWLLTFLGLGLSAMLLRLSDFSLFQWSLFLLLGAGCLVYGRIRSKYIALPWASCLTTLLLLLVYAVEVDDAGGAGQFKLIFILASVMYMVAGYAGIWKCAKPIEWAILSPFTAMAACGIARLSDVFAFTEVHWFIVGLSLTALYAVGAAAVIASSKKVMLKDTVASILIGFATAFYIIAIYDFFEYQWVAIGWAAPLPLLAFLAERFKLDHLRSKLFVLAALAMVRLINPLCLEYPMAEHWLLNWLPYGYLIPAAILIGTRYILSNRDNSGQPLWFEGAGFLSVLLMVVYMIRHGFEPGAVLEATPSMLECATYAAVLLPMAIGFWQLWKFLTESTAIHMAAIAGSLGTAGTMLCVTAFNPILSGEPVGEVMIVNWLLYMYALPALLFGFMAFIATREEKPDLASLFSVFTLVLLFITLSLEIRQSFNGSILNEGTPSNAEWYTYSVVWILYACGLLALGIWRKSKALRYASMVVMIVSVCKVFLFDTKHLQDLYRVVSFLGLGVSLILIALVYQRFVFGSKKRQSRQITEDF